MLKYRWLAISLAASCCLFQIACSNKPGSGENAGSPSTAAKPKYDFGTLAVSPNTGKGMETTFHLGVTGGAEKPTFLGLLINDSQNGTAACYVIQNFAANQTLLVADSGAGTVPSTAKSLVNHQCEILMDGTSGSVDAAGVNAAFHIRFSPAFKGVKHIWAMPTDSQMNGPALKQVGDWTVE